MKITREEYVKRVQAVDCVIAAVRLRPGYDRYAAYCNEGLLVTKDTYEELKSYLDSEGLTYVDVMYF